jgi:hypothetical protein
VAQFCLGYENARREGEKLGLIVLFGFEFAWHATEFLAYGLTPAFLYDHPGMDRWTPEPFLKRHIGPADTFRTRIPSGKRPIFLNPAVSGRGGRRGGLQCQPCQPAFNRKALAFAQAHGLAMTAGSDTHEANRMFGGGMVFPHAIDSAEALIAAIRAGEWEKPEPACFDKPFPRHRACEGRPRTGGNIP